MSEIHANEVDLYQDGKYRLMVVTQPGSMRVSTLQGGEIDAPFFVGDALLAMGEVPWIGPIGRAGAIDLAERILEGDLRARTDPRTILSLCTAIVAFIDPPTTPTGTEPQSGEQAAPAEAVAHG